MVDVAPTSTLHTHQPHILTPPPFPMVSVHTPALSPRLLDAQPAARGGPTATWAGVTRGVGATGLPGNPAGLWPLPHCTFFYKTQYFSVEIESLSSATISS